MLKTNTAKKLMNLLYKETASNLQSSQSLPRITRQLYNEPDDDSDILSMDPLSTYQSIKRKLPATEALKTDNRSVPIKSNILSFKAVNLFITKQDFQNLLPKDHNLTYSINPANNFEIIKKRQGKLLQFQNEYVLIFKNHLNARVYQLETQSKLINGIPTRFEYQSIDIIKDLVPPKLRVSNHQLLINQINSLKQASPELTEPTLLPLYDESYPILSNLINATNRRKSILIHNWPFGLKQNLVIDSLWNYNLSIDEMTPPIEPIYSNIMQEINTIKMNFKTELDALRFIHNFHGTKWLKLQNFRKVEEKVSHLPLFCEML